MSPLPKWEERSGARVRGTVGGFRGGDDRNRGAALDPCVVDCTRAATMRPLTYFLPLPRRGARGRVGTCLKGVAVPPGFEVDAMPLA